MSERAVEDAALPILVLPCDGEALAVYFDKRQERRLLLVVEVELAGRIEHDRVEIVQILRVTGQLLLSDELRIGSNERVPELAFLAKLFDRRRGVRDGVVLKSL